MDQVLPPSVGHPVARLCDRLGARLDDIGEAPLWSVSDAELTEMVRAVECQTRRLLAWQTRLVVEATGRGVAKTVAASGPVPWLAGTTTMARARARQLCRLAVDLGHDLDATMAAFGAGLIDADQAEQIATAVHRLPAEVGPQLRAEAEAFLLHQAGRHDATILAGFGHRLLERVAPELADQLLADQLARDQARDTHRRNTLSGVTDFRGRVRVRGELDGESWAMVSAALRPLAAPVPTVHPDRRTDRDPRTVGQRHADALVELCRRALAADQLPAHGGFPARLTITIDYDKLAANVGVGILDTGAAVSAADVRRIGCDCTLLPILLGSDSVPLDAGRAIRVFTKELRRAVEIRDIGCAFPGCPRNAAFCQIHHIVHWADGGPTSLDNGVLLCGHHHRLLHHSDWTVHLGADRRPHFTPPDWIDPNRRPLATPCTPAAERSSATDDRRRCKWPGGSEECVMGWVMWTPPQVL